jgi:TetR/AcrR family transcriptional regulator, transcriptional repressor for nem operon
VSKAERTRKHIVETTAPVFNRKGFDGTSLVDLTTVTGLTKGALYGNFEDKEQMAMEAFRYSMRKVKELISQHLANSTTYKQRLSGLLDFYASYVFTPPIPGGCPLLNTSVEADDHRTSMRRVVVKELSSTIDFITDLIEKGIETKEFRPDIEPKELAYTMFCALEGALIFSRVEKSRQPMDLIVRHCKNILDYITI